MIDRVVLSQPVWTIKFQVKLRVKNNRPHHEFHDAVGCYIIYNKCVLCFGKFLLIFFDGLASQCQVSHRCSDEDG